MEKKLRAGVITASDKGFAGERNDESGPTAIELLEMNGFTVDRYTVLPDELEAIRIEMVHMCDHMKLDLIITTGGTGFGERDVTPEATELAIQRNAPGIAEAIRANSAKITSRAMLSRGISGIRGKTLIINLPGSPKSVYESLDCIIEPVLHGLDILAGRDGECAR